MLGELRVIKFSVVLVSLIVMLGLLACDAVTSVQGSVLDSGRTPIANASVTLNSPSGRTQTIQTAADGKFHVTIVHGPTRKPFELVVEKVGYESVHREIPANTRQRLDVVLTRGE